MATTAAITTLSLFALALLCVAPGSGFHTGAPDSACGDLHPQHGYGVNPQTSASPFSITFTPTTFTPGSSSPITVTLTTESGATFEGFLLTTQYEGQGVDAGVRPGTFTTTPSVTRKLCSNSAVTHSDRNSQTSLSFQWTPPSASGGNIRFRATFVREKIVYWEDVKAAVLLVDSTTLTSQSPGSDPNNAHTQASQALASNDTTLSPSSSSSSPPPPPPSPANNTAPPASAGEVTRPADCGNNKGCYSMCQDGACSFVATWSAGRTEDTVRMTMSGSVESSDRYIALGLSHDDQMGSDSVVHCVNQPSGVFLSYNVDDDMNNELLAHPQQGLSDIEVTYEDHVLTCSFSRVKVADTSGHRFALNAPYTLLYATGPANGRKVGYHSAVRPSVSAQKASLVDFTANIGSSAPDNLFVRVHGSLMLVAWVFAASVGIVLARYFKDVWQHSAWCGQKVWFQLHRGCMVLALLATVTAFIIIFVEVGGYSCIHGKTYLKAHPILGIIVTSLTVINPVMALFRPHPNTPRRPIFNWAHWLVGSGAHILAVITVFFGLLMEKSGAGNSVLYVLAAYVCWQVLVQVVLEIVQYVARRRGDANSYEMTSINQPEPSKITAQKEGDFSKRLLLSVHVVVITGFIVALLVMLNTGSDYS